MTNPGIFLLQNGGLAELREQPYEAEHLLQSLIADYPHLLAGDQMDPAAPRRWLLVGRETAIPSEENGSARWALDHLFLDQEGVPTLVEVKRSSDTRIRREVVGQMLDYAANAVVHWPPELIRAQFIAACENSALDPDALVRDLVADDTEPDAFWHGVTRNLQAGRVRMVFVADVIPPELRRIVEFLNGQMNPAEVLAIEVRQFVGQGLTALVPRVVGQTAQAQQAKSTTTNTTKRQWDSDLFFAELRSRRNPEEEAVGRRLLSWSGIQGLKIWWGQGQEVGSFYAVLDHKKGATSIFSVWTNGRIEVQFIEMAKPSGGPFHAEEKRTELLRRLRTLPGVTMPLDVSAAKRPRVPCRR